MALSYVTYYSQEFPTPLLTHICYAFAELYVVGGQYRKFVQGDPSRFAAVADLKNHPHLKILLAFTHTVDNKDNAQGGGFSAMSEYRRRRQAFARDCLEFLQQWGIDGVDIGWEFPGLSWSGHASNPAADTQNHVLLLKELRRTLGSDYLITFPGYISDAKTIAEGTRYIDLKAVEPYVDFVNVMTYDMDQAPHHHSALEDSRAYWDCVKMLASYKAAGFPPEKIGPGDSFLRKDFLFPKSHSYYLPAD